MIIKAGILRAIRLYQKIPLTSYLLGKPFGVSFCRRQPTCSEFTYQSIAKYGIFRGSWQGIKRILRCHPWSKE
ncbi:membrane protein insertion efficiency factor YidD [Patescibacteria group bacterium]